MRSQRRPKVWIRGETPGALRKVPKCGKMKGTPRVVDTQGAEEKEET